MGETVLKGHRRTAATVFQTITSHVFSEFVIVLTGPVTYSPYEVNFFTTLRTMNETRPFKLVFLFEIPSFRQEEAGQEIAGALDLMTAEGFFDFLGSPPTIRSVQVRQRGWG